MSHWQAELLGKLNPSGEPRPSAQRVWFTGLNNTLWRPDISWAASEAFGSDVPESPGTKLWRELRLKYQASEINYEYLMRLLYWDLLNNLSLEELIRWAKQNTHLVQGATSFVRCLDEAGIGIVALSNGIAQIATPTLEYHGLASYVHLLANTLVGRTVQLLHEGELDKALVIQTVCDWGYGVAGFSGNGENAADIKAAKVTAELGGLVLVSGENGPLVDWCRGRLSPEQWETYTKLDAVLQMAKFRRLLSSEEIPINSRPPRGKYVC